MENIKAILFDSGKVLNYPQMGHWFISPRFFEYVDKEKFNSLSKMKVKNAFHQATKYINNISTVKTTGDELKHFLNFYRVFSTELPDLQLNDTQIEEIASDLVNNPYKYVFYEDALKTIPDLYNNYKLAIVSDAWPSLINVFENAAMKKYFSAFVISSLQGVSKPDKTMYNTALKELNVNPAQAVFIDDNIKNCRGAKELGINSILLCRDKRAYLFENMRGIGNEYQIINSLTRLPKLLCRSE